jgi:hypothetical protein
LIGLWNFLQTPDGDVAIAMVATIWLTGFVFWPRRSRKTQADAPLMAVDTPAAVPTNLTLSQALQGAMDVVREVAGEARQVAGEANEVTGEAKLETANTPKASPESWVAVHGDLVQLIPDHTGCTAVLKSGQDVIHARFDKTWLWYLDSLPKGRTLSIEGKTYASEQTDQQIDVFDCVCPDGIRVIQAGFSASSPGSAGNGRRSGRQPARHTLRHV